MSWRQVIEGCSFELVAKADRLALDIWWNSEQKIELHTLDLGRGLILRGTKTYFVKALSEEGELLARDIEPFHEWLETHFSNVRMSLTYLRDISRSLAIQRIREKGFRETRSDDLLEHGEERLSRIEAEFEKKRTRINECRALKRIEAMSSLTTPTIGELLRDEEGQLAQEAALLADEGKTLKRDLDVAKGLVEQYQRNASAVSVTFSVATEANWVHSDAELRDAVAAVCKELGDIHKFQIRQTLSGGRLRVPIEESTDPGMDLLGLWAGGYPNPATLERWGQSFDDFRREIQPRFMVLPVRDVVVSGAVKDQKKLALPRVVRAFLEQLPRCQGPSAGLSDLPTEGDFVGLVMDGAAHTRTAFLLPPNPGHILVSGTTRVGKTCAARVIMENFLLRKVKVIIIDPTRQWCGISRPTRDEMMLQRLEHFGIGRKNASGFPLRLFVPALGFELPSNPQELTGQSLVVSLKGLGDTERCRNAAHVLNAVYDCMMAENNQVILVVGIEEAHSFLPGNVVGNEAEEAAKEVRTMLTRIAREKLKYGVCLLLVSQSLADFHREARIVREMVNTRIFMRLKDPTETELVERYVSREAAEIVKNLRVGEALVHSTLVPATKVLIRPPLSDVGELSDEELREVCSGRVAFRTLDSGILTQDERTAVNLVREHYVRNRSPLSAQELSERTGIRGGSRQRLIDALESKGLIRKVQIRKTGQGRPSCGLVPDGPVVCGLDKKPE